MQPIEFNKKCTCTSFQQSKPFQKLQFAKKPIAKIVLFCVWMIKKITTIMKEVSSCLFKKLSMFNYLYNIFFFQAYGNFKRIVSTSISTKQQMKEFNQVIMTLRSENEQMINKFLEKITCLSDQITQVYYLIFNILRKFFYNIIIYILM